MASTLGPVFGPKDPRSAECLTVMNVALVSLITGSPFFGIVSTKLQLVEDNIRCKTMAVDGKHLFYNVNFILGCPEDQKAEFTQKIKDQNPDLTDEQIEEALAGLDKETLKAGIVHEILHCMTGTFIRQGLRNHRKWNRATDYEINQIIVMEKIGRIGKTWLYDAKYASMAAEEIYKLLDDEPENGGGSNWDAHYSPSDGSSSGDGSGQDKGTVQDVFSHASPSDIEEQMDDFKQTCMNAAQAANTPAGVERFLQQMVEPKIDWRSKIRRTLQSHLKRDQSFQRPSRRSWGMGVVLPGFLPEQTIDICVAIDMSGSIGVDMAKDFISEVFGMTKQFPSFKIKLLTFDTKVYNPQDFDETSIDKLLNYNIKGGGGTDFDVVWTHMKDTSYKPKQLIFMTDGYPCGSWGDPDYCDTLFVIHSNPNTTAPFGQTVQYEFEAVK